MSDKPKGKPRVVSVKKLGAILAIMEDIINVMHLPMHESERLKSRLWKIRDE